MNTLSNNVRLVGRLGAQPEVKTLDSGVTYAYFPLATDEGYKNKDGEYIDKPMWHEIKAFGKLAENISKILVKGQLVIIEGKLTKRSYEKDGVTHHPISVEVRNFMKLSKPKSEQST